MEDRQIPDHPFEKKGSVSVQHNQTLCSEGMMTNDLKPMLKRDDKHRREKEKVNKEKLGIRKECHDPKGT